LRLILGDVYGVKASSTWRGGSDKILSSYWPRAREVAISAVHLMCLPLTAE